MSRSYFHEHIDPSRGEPLTQFTLNYGSHRCREKQEMQSLTKEMWRLVGYNKAKQMRDRCSGLRKASCGRYLLSFILELVFTLLTAATTTIKMATMTRPVT